MYIIYYKDTKYGKACSDLGAVAGELNISRNTIVNWFRYGKTSHEDSVIIIAKADLVKSKRHGYLHSY